MLVRMMMLALLPVVASALFYFWEKKTSFGKCNGWAKQVVIGIVFGGIAICNTEFGVPMDGYVLNVRDAAPVCAALIFGAPAGILAGLIGGVERILAVSWGAGAFTAWSCAIATALSGIFAGQLRKFMFDNKKPAWYYGLSIGLEIEILHMLLLFASDLNNVERSFQVVQNCSLPMVTANGLSVMLSVIVVTLIGKEKSRTPKGHTNLSQAFQRGLLFCVLIAFVSTMLLTTYLQVKIQQNDTHRVLELNIEDVKAEIVEASDEHLLGITHRVASDLNGAVITHQLLLDLTEAYDVCEIDVVGTDGIISECSNADFVGYDMASGEQSAEFLCLLSGVNEFVQSYQPMGFDNETYRKYAGVTLENGSFVQVGYDSNNFQADIAQQVKNAAHNRHVGDTGCIIIADAQWNVVSDRENTVGQNLVKTGIWIDTPSMPEYETFSSNVYEERSFCMYTVSEGYYILSVLPYDEAVFSRNVAVYVTTFLELLVFATIFTLVYFMIKKLVVDNIKKINGTLAQITDGNLNVTVDVRSNQEFSSLSDDINSTVFTLKRYIAEAAARIDKELEFAKAIQYSALPSVFPPYPERTDFDIYASMTTAKEVGGDFYDFYLLGENKLAFLIADVSGKGIPAAMFMMRAKTLFKSLAESGKTLDEVFRQANNQLCENNDTNMFVTAWMGILDLPTGKLTFVNAGHNPPLFCKPHGSFAFVKEVSGLIVGVMDDAEYVLHERILTDNEMLFLYTDGVTEAMNGQDEQYGEERLLSHLNQTCESTVQARIAAVAGDVTSHAGDTEQSDDITMLAIQWHDHNAPKD